MTEKILAELVKKQILQEPIDCWSELKGGTESTVAVFGTKDEPNLYVYKSNTPERVAEEVRFFQTYKESPLLPVIRYVDPENRFFIYDYRPGETNYSPGSKQVLLQELVTRFVRHYVHSKGMEEYDWIENPARVKGDLIYSKSIIGDCLQPEDHRLAMEIQKERSNRFVKEELYVLHGDFGVHNYLFENGKLTGIIDPIPVAGRKLYDILYAFCSSPDDLELPILLSVVNHLEEKIDEDELIEDMLIALYFRVATCIKHHPTDLKQYLFAWSRWKQVWKGRGVSQ